jgi:hypothetical protein
MPETKSAVKRKTSTARGSRAGVFEVSGMRRLSDPDLKSAMTTLKSRISSEPAYGRSLLKRAGILTPKGNLKKSFGG